MTTTLLKVAIGFDVAEVDMSILPQQPQSDLVGPVVRNYSGGGEIWEQGLVCRYLFTHVEDDEYYYFLLSYFDLHLNESGPVTFLAKNKRMEPKRWNGIAQLPEANQDVKWSNFFPRDIAIYFVDVEEAA